MTRLGVCALAVVALASCASAPAPTAHAAPKMPDFDQPSAVTNYRRLEMEVFTELNSARTDPARYADHLAELLPLFNGRLVHRPGWHFALQTREGASAVREAIDALHRQKPLPPLVLDRWLAKAALDHTADQGRTGQIGHVGSDNSGPAERIDRYGSWTRSYGENIDYGGVLTGRDVVEDMLIDDGVPDRGHRENTFDAGAHVVGIGCGPHPKFGVVCVIDQANGFVPRSGKRQN